MKHRTAFLPRFRHCAVAALLVLSGCGHPGAPTQDPAPAPSQEPAPALAPVAPVIDGQEVTLDVTTWVLTCQDQPALSVEEGGAWREASTSLPPKGGYWLDDQHVDWSTGCDYVTCQPASPLRALLVEFVEDGTRDELRVFRTKPLHGHVRVTWPTFDDAECHVASTVVTEVEVTGN